MVINENTLLKLMEKAYKGGGYHLAVSREPFHGCFMIANYGYSWACVIEDLKMPWAALGMIVKHIGRIPEADEAYLVHKEDIQDEVFDVSTEPLMKLLQKAGTALPTLKKSRLTFDSCNVWQRSDNLEVVLMDPDYEELGCFKEVPAQIVDLCMYAQDAHSAVMIHKITPGDHEKSRIDHLGHIQWT